MSRPTTEIASATLEGEQNPFLRYRERLDVYQEVATGDMTDEQFVDIVSRIDERVAAVWGHGFLITPLLDGCALAAAADIGSRLFIKVEANNVGGSHKARHLMGVMIFDQVRRLRGSRAPERLAIASCGNAAMGAAVIARAMDRPLDVFVPTWADESVVAALDELGAHVNRCERRPGESGDPCFLRFQEAIGPGTPGAIPAASPFGVQSTDTPMTIDGGKTIGFEIAEQAGHVDALYVQVGGGALATATAFGVPDARLYPVQAEGCAPLRRAWDRWGPEFDLDAAQEADQQFMTPWDDPHSFATGILDDITYDWVPLLHRTHQSGGHPIVAPEPLIRRAYELAHAHTDVDVCSTGTAGLAGLMTEPVPGDEHVVVLFSGIDRS